MNVLVDTSVWSLALRRDQPRGTRHENELVELISEGRVLMLGAVRQELLSGIRAVEQFRKLRDRLRAFPDISIGQDDYEEAASCFNRCRGRGIQGSNTDFLLCAVALREDVSILTTDDDFVRFAGALRVCLHQPRG
jgi:predicted nucleic acid-binding protein